MVQEVGCIFTVTTRKVLKQKRKGLSLIELVVVLIIVGIILVGFAASASTQVKRANRSDVENELQVMSSNLSDAYYDLGNPTFEPADDAADGTTTERARFKRFLITLETYLGCQFDRGSATDTADFGSITATDLGYYVEIKEPLDTYEQTYKCWFVTSKEAPARYAMICSGGDNTIVEYEGYASNNYSDDIVLIIYPKTEE